MQISSIEQENMKIQTKASEFWSIINDLQATKEKEKQSNELKAKMFKKRIDELELEREKFNLQKKDATEGLTKA